MFGTQQLQRSFHQFEHFVASLNAAGMVLDLTAGQICPGKVDGLQKILNAAAIFNLEFTANLLHRKLQRPDHITVFSQQLPCVVVQRVLSDIIFLVLLFHRFDPPVC